MAEEKETVQEEMTQAENKHSSEQVEEVFAEAADVQTEGANEEPSESDAEFAALQLKVTELESKLEEAENRYLRLHADFENSRRRAKLDREASEKYRAQSLITDLLPAIDNFERAMQTQADDEHVKSLLQGMDMVYRSLIDALKKEGAEQIEAVGKEFDPHVHQAVMQVEDDQFGSNIVVEEFQKGYMLKDRVIRPAMVKVNQ
ncbi:molecular chaperone GrpE [Cytobacillus horneckiae]|nr:nucleotide exchange factor GrpE [Cytobacillus horneckiae]MCM3179889.1 nucleotide exchange factor GrpE [Cytobacillus horneckiae]MEC1155278.1 nucleotide exchange factor GrpE [Cytobacillus horneckiae]MED2936669.1 nucleotide exchange factor GrpE [Cytobacillus horneckiae]